MKYHLIGIEGSAMSGLAEILRSRGHDVTGSDLQLDGHSPNNISADVQRVVYTPAVREDSPAWTELKSARGRQLDVLRSDELLGELTQGKKLLAVTGSHGKSSTTAMLAHILLESGHNPTVLLGAPVPSWQNANYHVGEDVLWVLEADDYDRKFLTLHPDIAVVTNIDREHLDVYESLEDIQQAFAAFVWQIKPDGHVIAWEDQSLDELVASVAPSVKVTRYGPGASVSPDRLPALNIIGDYQALNASGAVAAALAFGIELPAAMKAVATFTGTGRRLEHIGSRGGIDVYDDYGHHPTEIIATTQAVKTAFPDHRFVLAFQPHQHSRVNALFDEFAQSFGAVDKLLLVDIYAVPGRNEGVTVDTSNLASAIADHDVDVTHVGTLDDLSDRLDDTLQPGDVFVTMGATDITNVGRNWVAFSKSQ